MRILMCCHEYPPAGSGIAYVAFHLTKSLRKLGHQVDVCAPRNGSYEIGSAQSLIEKFGGLGIIYFWFRAGKLLKKLASDYDIIYLHNPLLFHKIRSPNIRCITHTLYYFMFRDYGFRLPLLFPYYRFMLFFEKMAYRNIKSMKFIVISPKIREELLHYNIPFEQISLMTNGHDFDARRVTTASLQIKLSPERRNILYVGRFDPVKNLFSLLKTFKKMNCLSDLFTLTIIGEGYLKKKLLSFVRNNNVSHVNFVERMPHENLLELYSSFDFIVLASHYEGCPISLTEALGEGLIPLLSAIPIFKHVQEKVQSGLIVNFDNPCEAASSIVRYCKKIDVKKESEKIKSVSKKLFDWDKIAQDYLALERP